MAKPIELVTPSGRKSTAKHGTPYAYKKLKCRCFPCRQAMNDYIWGRYKVNQPRVPKHGTVNEYKHWKCRCARCKRANTLMKREEKRRANERALRDTARNRHPQEQKRTPLSPLQSADGQADKGLQAAGSTSNGGAPQFQGQGAA